MELLPELWIEILSYLNGYERCQIATVNSLFYCVYNEDRYYPKSHIRYPEKYCNIRYFKFSSLERLFEYKQTEMIKKYLKKKSTPLCRITQLSIKYGNLEMTKEYVPKSIKLNDFQTLVSLCKGGHFEMFQYVIERYQVNISDQLHEYIRKSPNPLIPKYIRDKHDPELMFGYYEKFDKVSILNIDDSDLYYTLKAGNLDLYNTIIKSGYSISNWNDILEGASYSGIIPLMQKGIDKGGDLKEAFKNACRRPNNHESIKFLMKYYEPDDEVRYIITFRALRSGNTDIFDLIKPNYLSLKFEFICNRREIFLWVLKEGASDYYAALLKAIDIGDTDLFEELARVFPKLREYVDSIMLRACETNNVELLNYCITHGARNFNEAIRTAFRFESIDCFNVLENIRGFY